MIGYVVNPNTKELIMAGEYGMAKAFVVEGPNQVVLTEEEYKKLMEE